MSTVARYKGKKYRYVDTFTGKDRRKWVKMQWFSDATKEFVAPADQVTVSKDTGGGAGSRSSGPNYGGRCRQCGGPIEDASHYRAMGRLCGSCAFDEYDM